MIREVEFHEVVVKFFVRKEEAARAAKGCPGLREIPYQEPFDSKVRRGVLAAVVRGGIGGNEMNSLDAEDVTITVDGQVQR